MKLHAQALIPTSDPSGFGESMVRELAGEWGAAASSVRVLDASCDIHAWPDGLRLDAYADSEAALIAGERALNDVVTRMGANAIDWYTRPSTLPGASPLPEPVRNFPAGDDDE